MIFFAEALRLLKSNMSSSKKQKRDKDDETKQERAQRKEAKKAEKVAKLLGYTNDSNPFMDNNLLQPFVWGKKAEQNKSNVKKNDSPDQRYKLMNEIEKVRKRRLDRENELEEMDRLRGEEQRLRDAILYDGWQKKEEDFHLEQTKQRSKLRLLSNREKPIDTIAKIVLLAEARSEEKSDLTTLFLDAELKNPVDYIQQLSVNELDEVLTDIGSYKQLEMSRSGSYVDFWTAMHTVASSRHSELKDGNILVQDSVMWDIKNLLCSKSREDLLALQSDIEKNLRRGGSDVEYWEVMKRQVAVHLAMATINKLFNQLQSTQMEMQAAAGPRVKPSSTSDEHESDQMPSLAANQSGSSGGNDGDSEDNMDQRDEVALTSVVYSWQDKHRPRKPRYFNRVKTGWDWNKYNQTHYDFDNPPPKVVQGYKFTLFYPDLIDTSTTPKYYIEPCLDSKEFVIIRFHAGPPYEDLAFKIANREWDVNRRAGFVSVFERGVLQLHFNFKRAFYRR